MSPWAVEIEDDLIEQIGLWPEDQQMELVAIQERLERGGPEGMGLIKAELEGVPAWRNLSTPLSLLLPISTRSGWRTLALEVQPNFRLVVVRLE